VSLLGEILSNLRWDRKAVSRSSQRFTVLTPAKIRPERVDGEWIDCMLENLSDGGASIHGRLDLKRREHIGLRMNLGFGHDIGVRARVVYASTGPGGTRSTYGVRFTDLAYADCQDLVAYLATRESASRQGVRIRTGP